MAISIHIVLMKWVTAPCSCRWVPTIRRKTLPVLSGWICSVCHQYVCHL